MGGRLKASLPIERYYGDFNRVHTWSLDRDFYNSVILACSSLKCIGKLYFRGLSFLVYWRGLYLPVLLSLLLIQIRLIISRVVLQIMLLLKRSAVLTFARG